MLLLVVAFAIFAIAAPAFADTDSVDVTLTVNSYYSFSGTPVDWAIGNIGYNEIGDTLSSANLGTYTYYTNGVGTHTLTATFSGFTAFNMYAKDHSGVWTSALGATPAAIDSFTGGDSRTTDVYLALDGIDLTDAPGNYSGTVVFTYTD